MQKVFKVNDRQYYVWGGGDGLMVLDFWRYCVGIVVRPRRTLNALVSDNRLLMHGALAYGLYGLFYTVFVTNGYIVLDRAGLYMNSIS